MHPSSAGERVRGGIRSLSRAISGGEAGEEDRSLTALGWLPSTPALILVALLGFNPSVKTTESPSDSSPGQIDTSMSDTVPNKKELEEGNIYFSSQLQWIRSIRVRKLSWWSVRWLVTRYPSVLGRKKRQMKAGALSPFIQSRTTPLGMVAPTPRVSQPPMSVKPV